MYQSDINMFLRHPRAELVFFTQTRTLYRSKNIMFQSSLRILIFRGNRTAFRIKLLHNHDHEKYYHEAY